MSQEKTTVWAFLEKFIFNKWTWIVIGILAALYFIYASGKKSGAGDQAKLPNAGAGIPAGWTPTPAATALHGAMDTGAALWGAIGYGTDEEAIFSTLEALPTADMLAAVNNEFNRLYQAASGMNLRQWFEDELSGEELTRALNYFTAIPGF